MTTTTGKDVMDDEAAVDSGARRQRSRSIAIAWSLGILVLIFYAATIVRLGPKALSRDDFGHRTLQDAASSGASGAAGDAAPASETDCKKAGTC